MYTTPIPGAGVAGIGAGLGAGAGAGAASGGSLAVTGVSILGLSLAAVLLIVGGLIAARAAYLTRTADGAVEA